MNVREEVAIFAGGCFWCVEYEFDQVKGVLYTVSGYTGGDWPNPTYEKVCSGKTGHVEALQVTYDPQIVTYQKLLDVYWHAIDPTQSEGQFCDIGTQYRPVIFYLNEEQKKLAEISKDEVSKKIRPMKVEILPAQTFYPAEEHHQKYYKKSPFHYNLYHEGSGRDQRLNELWH